MDEHLDLVMRCRNGVQKLIEKNHQDFIFLGMRPIEEEGVKAIFNGYYLGGGRLYVGLPIPNFVPGIWPRKEVSLDDVPFSEYTIDNLIEVDKKISEALRYG